MSREEREFYWDVAKTAFAFAFGSSAAIAVVVSGYKAAQIASREASAKLKEKLSFKNDDSGSPVEKISDE